MATLADVQEVADGVISLWVDDETLPAGHFGAVVQARGQLLTAYVFEGRNEDPEAVVKGRIEYVKEDEQLVAYGFAQGGLSGGSPLGRVLDYKETFAQMA